MHLVIRTLLCRKTSPFFVCVFECYNLRGFNLFDCYIWVITDLHMSEQAQRNQKFNNHLTHHSGFQLNHRKKRENASLTNFLLKDTIVFLGFVLEIRAKDDHHFIIIFSFYLFFH